MNLVLIRHPRQRIFFPAMRVRPQPPAGPERITIRPDLVRPLQVVEREAVESALILCGGNALLAAQRLRIGRSSLYRKIRQWRRED